MRAQSPIATAPSATTDGRITELHLWAVREGLRRAPEETFHRIQEELDWSELDAAPAGSFQSLAS